MKKLTFDELEDKLLEEMTDEEWNDILDRLYFDTVPSYSIYKLKTFEFETDDGMEVVTEFSELIDDRGKFDFIYKVNGTEFQAKVVPYSIYGRILSTLSNIIQGFVNENKPISVFLKSTPRKEGQVQDKSKHTIHGHLLKMQIGKLPEYDYKELEDGWLIFRK